MATKTPKKSRSNVSQAPENLPSRSESAKNGVLNPDAPLTEMQWQFVVYLVDHGMTQTAAARAAAVCVIWWSTKLTTNRRCISVSGASGFRTPFLALSRRLGRFSGACETLERDFFAI